MEHRQDFPLQVEEAPQQDKALAVVDFQVLSRRVVECHQCSFRLDRPDLAVEDLQADRDLVVVDHREAGLAADSRPEYAKWAQDDEVQIDLAAKVAMRIATIEVACWEAGAR